MASLVRKKSGFILRWTDSNRSPKCISESLKTAERDRALYLKRKLEYEYLDGKHDPWVSKWYELPERVGSAPNLKHAVESYLNYKIEQQGRHGWSETTYKAKAHILHSLAKTIGQTRHLPSIRSEDLRSFYNRPSIKSDHTREGQRRTVIALLNWCKDQGYIKHVPECDIEVAQEQLPEFFRMNQLESIYKEKQRQVQAYLDTGYSSNSDNQYWMIDAWKLAAATGLRRMELMSLRVGSIDMAGQAILVGYQHKTKSRRQRIVPFLFEAEEILEKYTNTDFRSGDKYLSRTDMLFGRQGEQMSKRLNNELVRIRKVVIPDRPELTLHSLRHTFAVRYLSAPGRSEAMDFRLRKLQQILGHASINTTERYLKAIPHNLRL